MKVASGLISKRSPEGTSPAVLFSVDRSSRIESQSGWVADALQETTSPVGSATAIVPVAVVKV